MRTWYFINKFLSGVRVGLICGGITTLLLALTAVICYHALS